MGSGETPVPSPEKKKLRVDHEDKSSNAAAPVVVKMEPSPTLPDPSEVGSQSQPEQSLVVSPTAPTIPGDLGDGDAAVAVAEPAGAPKQLAGPTDENLEGQGKASDEPMSMEPQNLEGQFAKAVEVDGNQTPPASPGAIAAVMVLWLIVDWGE